MYAKKFKLKKKLIIIQIIKKAEKKLLKELKKIILI